MNPEAIDRTLAALKVIALDPKTSEILKAIDPQAYNQALEAIEAAEAKPVYVFEARAFPMEYDDKDDYCFAGDFRTEDNERANYDLVAEIANNFDGDGTVTADAELSEFYAYVGNKHELGRLILFVSAWVADQGHELDIDSTL